MFPSLVKSKTRRCKIIEAFCKIIGAFVEQQAEYFLNILSLIVSLLLVSNQQKSTKTANKLDNNIKVISIPKCNIKIQYTEF